MTATNACQRMLAGMVLILPATALACLPFLIGGVLLDDMRPAKWLFVLYELGGAVLGLVTLD